MNRDGRQGDLSRADYDSLDGNLNSFSDLTITSYPQAFNVTGQNEPPERLTGLSVDTNFFDFLGIGFIYGSGLRNDDPYSAVITYDLWQRRFDGEKSIIGRYINLNGVNYRIVAVLRQNFRWLSYKNSSIFIPLTPGVQGNASDYVNDRSYIIVGRLKPRVLQGFAQAELRTVFRHLEEQDHLGSNGPIDIRLVPLVADSVSFLIPRLMLLQIAVAFILLISCSNVANLIIARSFTRTKEFSIRQALGAPRRAILRQFFVEGFVLSLCGSVLGLGASFWGGRLIAPVLRNAVPFSGINFRVVGVSLVVLFIATTIFSLAPAVFVMRSSGADQLGDSRSGATTSPKAHRLRTLLIVLQLSLSVVLLIGAELMVKSFIDRSRVPINFDARNILVDRVPLLNPRYKDPATRRVFVEELISQTEALPGVEFAAAATWIPLRGGDLISFETPDSQRGQTQQYKAIYRGVTSGFFDTLGAKFIAGRDFTLADMHADRNVVIVSRAMAQKYWGRGSPIGKYIKIETDTPGWCEVVGVVDNIPDNSIYDVLDPVPQVYRLTNDPSDSPWIMIRTHSAPFDLLPSLRRVVEGLDHNQPLAGGDALTSMQREVADELQVPRILMSVFVGLAVLAVLMATLGVYGMASYLSLQRRQEIGIRIALGATREDILKFILVPASILTVCSLSAGLLCFFFFRRLLAGFVFGVSTSSTGVLATSILVIGVVAMVSTFIPAKKASEIDPISSLKS